MVVISHIGVLNFGSWVTTMIYNSFIHAFTVSTKSTMY